jgi:adenylosuccinate synthase
MQLLNTKLLICVLAGLVAIAATLAEIRKTQAQQNAAASQKVFLSERPVVIDSHDLVEEVNRRNKKFEDEFRRDKSPEIGGTSKGFTKVAP